MTPAIIAAAREANAAGVSQQVLAFQLGVSHCEIKRRLGFVEKIRDMPAADREKLARIRLNRLMRIRAAALGPVVAPNAAARIIDNVAREHGIAPLDLIGQTRTKHIALARHIAMYIMRNRLHLPMQKIGVYIGGRDHTSVLHGVRRIQRLIDAGGLKI